MAVVGRIFLDTSVLLAGLIELGPTWKAAQALFGALATSRPRGRTATAWHCCLEFYAVATRLPEEFRLTPADALALLEAEVLGRFTVHDLQARRRLDFLRTSAREQLRGGRLYDAHIAEIARQSGAQLVVTENTRHFASLERQGIRVRSAAEALRELRAS